MICPITTEQLTKKGGTLEEIEAEWQTVFLIASAIHIFGVIFYAIFASGEVTKTSIIFKIKSFSLFLYNV